MSCLRKCLRNLQQLKAREEAYVDGACANLKHLGKKRKSKEDDVVPIAFASTLRCVGFVPSFLSDFASSSGSLMLVLLRF